MATASRDRHASAQGLAATIRQALVNGALPGELDGFDGEARDDAASFVAEAAATRAAGKAVVAIESVAAGERRRHMRLAIINDDMPFLVDSVAATIAAHGLAIDRLLHPVLSVRRDDAGRLTDVLDDDAEGERRESMIYVEVERADAKERRALVTTIERNLNHVRAAVSDWPAMQTAMRADADRLPDGEGAALLRWFLDRHFTQLAHEMRDRKGAVSAPLGVSRVDDTPLLAPSTITDAFRWFEEGGDAPLAVKSNRIATVHRHVPLDVLIVPVREGGRIIALSLHAGLWTSSALNAAPEKVPVLRARLAALQEKYRFDPSGHAGKALSHALAALPHDLLIAFEPAALETVALTSMSLADRPRARLVGVPSPLGRHLFAFVWLPRDESTTQRRTEIGEMLTQAANATLLNWAMAMEEGSLALVRYTLDLRDGGTLPDMAVLDARLEQMMRGWVPAVEAILAEGGDQGRAARLALRYAPAFPSHYRATSGPVEAARDITRLQGLSDSADRDARLLNDASAESRLRLKIYNGSGSVPLSDAVPVLENFGFRVIEEMPTALDHGTLGYVHDFVLDLGTSTEQAALFDRADVVEQAIAAVLSGRAENDAFNRLIVCAALNPRAIVLFRAWFRYLRQTGLSYGLTTVVDALARAPKVAAALIALFDARHDPAAGRKSGDAADAAQAALDAGLRDVAGADDDRILRLLKGVVAAILRTNAFAPGGREALAFKFDSALVPGLPAPVPWREIFVYSARIEAIHLRTGPIARGGLRWSDRRDDFRTEVLGLMKAQRVKNAVIVPTGAKGGFYAKQLPDPSNRDAWLEEGKESYRVFIRALLSVTDNIVGGKVVHPEKVVALDGDDPYFVVAADKGTASFSDVANAIAEERNFWLGDAFASGGSHGYDHKGMGITARGAWISVQRHFAERGVDVQTESVRVVGCGDMSGDVFGNGMLLSKAIKLVAAFDHRHIFLDPDPDPAKSWTERQRLFSLPRSSWADYDAKLISAGGGVYPRSAKTVPLTPEVRALLSVTETEMEPTALISAILKSPADLLWFGGIGTYVKAKAQANSEVGDPANDRLRVNGEDVRATAIGEGANLGVTQAGRIAYALKGGRNNADFIDNSAGVDCSDNEVNIKIALNREVKEGRLGFEDRNTFLESMTDDVAALVLEDNRMQTLALSIAESGGAAALPSYVRLIEIFESEGRLDRAVEGLAPNEELLRRAQDKRGLTRPELAVLLATAKLALQDGIERGAMAADPALASELHAAFPMPMQKRFAAAIDAHQLRGEIIATKVANRIVNRMGLIVPFELAEEEGASLADIATVFITAERLFGIGQIWADIDAAAISEEGRLMLLDQVAAAMRAQMADLIRTIQPGQQPSDLVAMLAPGIKRLDAKVDEILRDEGRAAARAIADRLTAVGAPIPLVQRVTRLFELDGAIGLAALGARSKVDETVLASAFTALGAALGLDWAQTTAIRLHPTDPWERLLTAGLARDFQQMRLDFLARAGGKAPEAKVADWLGGNATRVTAFRDVIKRARGAAVPNAAMLAQVAGQARVLLSH
ncbi:NAD-glutamate dehydrogenase [Sphingomonas flavalba]|uniref:NAD-glutamate dehydrogenase n=1 Tax=Sphingomonas flavalba TaxID=2559804 RepID=UPI00109DCC36|nr:NAD-glutamate dehydrogenase domain-containing protein [Sphingomonas flavalba]